MASNVTVGGATIRHPLGALSIGTVTRKRLPVSVLVGGRTQEVAPSLQDGVKAETRNELEFLTPSARCLGRDPRAAAALVRSEKAESWPGLGELL